MTICLLGTFESKLYFIYVCDFIFLSILVDLILIGLFFYLPVSSYFILKSLANCLISYGFVSAIPFWFRLTIDFLLILRTRILLVFLLIDVAELTLTKLVFLLLWGDLDDWREPLLIWDFLSYFVMDWFDTLEFISDLLD